MSYFTISDRLPPLDGLICFWNFAWLNWILGKKDYQFFLLIFSKLHTNLNITFAMRSFESLLVTIMNTACWSDQRSVQDLLPASQKPKIIQSAFIPIINGYWLTMYLYSERNFFDELSAILFFCQSSTYIYCLSCRRLFAGTLQPQWVDPASVWWICIWWLSQYHVSVL